MAFFKSLILCMYLFHMQNVNAIVRLNKCPGSSLLGDVNFLTLPSSIMTSGTDTTFRLESDKWSCSHGSEEIYLTAGLVNNSFSNDTVYKFDYPQIGSDGLLDAETERGIEYFNAKDYCIESIEESEIALKVCKFQCGLEGGPTCVPKCCLWDEAIILDGPNPVCKPKGQQGWLPIMHHNETHTDCSTKKNPSPGKCIDKVWKKENLHYNAWNPTCPNPHTHVINPASPDYDFRLLINGSIRSTNSIVISSGFCIDGLLDEKQMLTEHVLLFCRSTEQTKAMEDERKLKVGVSIVYISIMFFSSLFLLLTVIVYILIWDKHNLHGYTVFSHSVSMFFMLIFLASAHLMGIKLYHEDSGSFSCTAVGILSHYFILTTFAWLSILNLDLWWTFKTLSPSIAKSKGLQRFMYYSLFAWGVPIIFVGIAYILDTTNSISSTIPVPGYGHGQCYLKGSSQGWYLYLPIGTLLGLNIVFFGTTVYTMYKYQQSTRSAREGKAHGQSQSLQLFVKLFLVMGVTWILEVISWSVTKGDKVSFVWLPFDLVNLLQGISIFIIFVCKRQVLAHLWTKYPRQRWLLAPVRSLSCCKPTGIDVEGREVSGVRTTQSNISMKNFSRSNSLSEA